MMQSIMMRASTSQNLAELEQSTLFSIRSALASGNTIVKLNALKNAASNYYLLDKQDTAFKMLSDGLALAKAHNAKAQIADFYVSLAFYYRHAGEKEKALAAAHNGLSVALEHRHTDTVLYAGTLLAELFIKAEAQQELMDLLTQLTEFLQTASRLTMLQSDRRQYQKLVDVLDEANVSHPIKDLVK
ncbi:hypothetical protein [Alteromonas oceanisediminis]|uniref:hypothetical protein n=1 Tax=Alteromonas oceanisediminis TaxID=2836180 RepID=UPI001BD9FD79|nr:hypothetical protein [Alteromonas oceanisediminis]MBT0587896.1 hypothetical protein [Alteromonas oceanisediminis]